MHHLRERMTWRSKNAAKPIKILPRLDRVGCEDLIIVDLIVFEMIENFRVLKKPILRHDMVLELFLVPANASLRDVWSF